MNNFLPFPALRTSYRKVALLGIFALMGVSSQSYAQTNPLTQTFGDDPVKDANYPFTSITPATNKASMVQVFSPLTVVMDRVRMASV